MFAYSWGFFLFRAFSSLSFIPIHPLCLSAHYNTIVCWRNFSSMHKIFHPFCIIPITFSDNFSKQLNYQCNFLAFLFHSHTLSLWFFVLIKLAFCGIIFFFPLLVVCLHQFWTGVSFDSTTTMQINLMMPLYFMRERKKRITKAAAK